MAIHGNAHDPQPYLAYIAALCAKVRADNGLDVAGEVEQ